MLENIALCGHHTKLPFHLLPEEWLKGDSYIYSKNFLSLPLNSVCLTQCNLHYQAGTVLDFPEKWSLRTSWGPQNRDTALVKVVVSVKDCSLQWLGHRHWAWGSSVTLWQDILSIHACNGTQQHWDISYCCWTPPNSCVCWAC